MTSCYKLLILIDRPETRAGGGGAGAGGGAGRGGGDTHPRDRVAWLGPG